MFQLSFPRLIKIHNMEINELKIKLLSTKFMFSLLSEPVFIDMSTLAEEMGVELYLIGGYVRDMILDIPNDDIDICVVGSGIEYAKALAKRTKTKVDLFENYGTAKVAFDFGGKHWDMEFVGARREFYKRGSRNPIVENGTLEDDMARRDFTINDMAISLNKATMGQLIDPYDGLSDIQSKTIRCVSDPNERFSEDPLRMLRAIRFASKLGFTIDSATLDAIKSQADSITIIVKERILEEINKVLVSPVPSVGLNYLQETGLMKILLPEIACLEGKEVIDGVGHKDILKHTFQVVDNVANVLKELNVPNSSKTYLLWAALLHDMGKNKVKEFHKDSKTWTFKNHEIIGADMVKNIYNRYAVTNSDKITKLVKYHMRPMQLCEDGVTDSAIRRFIYEAGDDIDDIMILVNSDLTTSYADRKRGFQEKYEALKVRMKEIEESDALRNFKLAFNGDDIMNIFNIPVGREVGRIKQIIKDKVIDGELPNDYEAIKNYINSEILNG